MRHFHTDGLLHPSFRMLRLFPQSWVLQEARHWEETLGKLQRQATTKVLLEWEAASCHTKASIWAERVGVSFTLPTSKGVWYCTWWSSSRTFPVPGPIHMSQFSGRRSVDPQALRGGTESLGAPPNQRRFFFSASETCIRQKMSQFHVSATVPEEIVDHVWCELLIRRIFWPLCNWMDSVTVSPMEKWLNRFAVCYNPIEHSFAFWTCETKKNWIFRTPEFTGVQAEALRKMGSASQQIQRSCRVHLCRLEVGWCRLENWWISVVKTPHHFVYSHVFLDLRANLRCPTAFETAEYFLESPNRHGFTVIS